MRVQRKKRLLPAVQCPVCSAQGSEGYRIKETVFAASGYTTHWCDETHKQFPVK